MVEGNRRLAALKALLEPGLLDGKLQRQVERFSRLLDNRDDIAQVPVTFAPSRRATDQLIAGRHIGTPVLSWRTENRASFILEKLSEGYTNDQLRDELGFTLADIQEARQMRAIADMARSVDLPAEVKAKLDRPRTTVFTTLERVFDSSEGRKHLMVAPDPDHGFKGKTTKAQFLKGFKRLVQDVVLGNESSRSLNTNDDIARYFRNLNPSDTPAKKRGSFLPADIIQGRSVASSPVPVATKKSKTKAIHKTVLPASLKIHQGSDRICDIRRELTRLKRDDFPNAGAVLLRVFIELTFVEYLEREGLLKALVEKIEKKGHKVPRGIPVMKQLVPEIIRIAKDKLNSRDALMVEKALTYNRAAPFTISELHGFVHQDDLPGARDILQFWNRVKPILRLMLEGDESG